MIKLTLISTYVKNDEGKFIPLVMFATNATEEQDEWVQKATKETVGAYCELLSEMGRHEEREMIQSRSPEFSALKGIIVLPLKLEEYTEDVINLVTIKSSMNPTHLQLFTLPGLSSGQRTKYVDDYFNSQIVEVVVREVKGNEAQKQEIAKLKRAWYSKSVFNKDIPYISYK